MSSSKLTEAEFKRRLESLIEKHKSIDKAIAQKRELAAKCSDSIEKILINNENMKYAKVKLEADLAAANEFMNIKRKKMVDHIERFQIEEDKRKEAIHLERHKIQRYIDSEIEDYVVKRINLKGQLEKLQKELDDVNKESAEISRKYSLRKQREKEIIADLRHQIAETEIELCEYEINQ